MTAVLNGRPPRNNNLSNKVPILIAGPTGVGKSSFAVALAQRVGGEILCADAFQFYAGLAVLTAQPPVEKQGEIPHHLYGSIDPAEAVDASRFLGLVEPLVSDILARNRYPLLVGGTGLYLKAFTHGLDELPPVNPELRRRLSATPLAELQAALRSHDPEAAVSIDLQNPRRVQRALEIILSSGGQPLRHFRQAWQAPPKRPFRAVLLQREQEDLEERIAANVTAMLEGDACEEVRAFAPFGSRLLGPTAAKAIGVSSVQRWLRQEIGRSACEQEIFLLTRQYAKRQCTWFARQQDYEKILLPRNVSMEEAAKDFVSTWADLA